MNYTTYAFIFVLFFMLTFMLIRCVIRNIIDFRINKSSFKKKKKGQTFREWFFYSRLWDIVPNYMLVIYFINLAISVLSILGVIIFSVLDANLEYLRKWCLFLVIFYGLVSIFYRILLFKYNGNPNLSRIKFRESTKRKKN